MFQKWQEEFKYLFPYVNLYVQTEHVNFINVDMLVFKIAPCSYQDVWTDEETGIVHESFNGRLQLLSTNETYLKSVFYQIMDMWISHRLKEREQWYM